MMRKEHYIFLVFMVSAAIVCGYTLAFASCYKVIMNDNPPAVLTASADGISPADASVQQQSDPAAPTQVASADTETEMMVISAEEQKQIEEMLITLGMQEGQNMQDFLIDYQKEQNLQPTGNLDSMTLNSVIIQTKLYKTVQQMNS